MPYPPPCTSNPGMFNRTDLSYSPGMKIKTLTAVAGFVFLLGVAFLGASWNGNASLNFGWPASSNSVQFCGSASGLSALAGVVGIVAGVVLIAISMIRALLRTAPR